MVHHVRMRVVSFFGYAGAGILFVIALSVVLAILAMFVQIVDPSATQEGTIFSITQLAESFVMLQPAGIIFGIFLFLIIGFVVWIFGIVGVKLRRAIGVKQDEKVSFAKRPAILAFFIAGIITVIIFAGLGAILNGLTEEMIDLTSINTLFDAVATGDPLLFLGVIIGLAIVGFLVIKIAEIEKTTGEAVLPKDFRVGESP